MLLEGLKVVEMATWVAGPSCAAVMADWGAEVVKVDTEGHELPILQGYDMTDTLYVAYEYHRTEDRILLDALMRERGFTLVGGMARNHWLGTCKWLRMPVAE